MVVSRYQWEGPWQSYYASQTQGRKSDTLLHSPSEQASFYSGGNKLKFQHGQDDFQHGQHDCYRRRNMENIANRV